MNSTTTKLDQKPPKKLVAESRKEASQNLSTKLIFMGIVILALCCWLMLVNFMTSTLIVPATASAAIIFLAALNYFITDAKPDQK
ncbi:MAG: hypothetical protein HWE21_08745 [Cytophagia bacterium]|nr:hypothetical protein [Cytophagia bacterium]